jgi:endonuclease/exonuclease/phosphatase family metal-dependent hydrolase
LVFGYKYIARTYQCNFHSEKKGKLKLLSYNVRVFNNYSHYRTPSTQPSKLIKWVSDNDAEIKCFQEFYNAPASDSFNVIPRLRKNTPHYYLEPALIFRDQYFGLAIFSKYPIVKKGEIKFRRRTFNQAIYADIAIKKDTVRVYNIHLQSMSIDESKLPTTESENFWGRAKYLFRKLKKGAILRTDQVQLLVEHMEKSPYKVILAGDLNDTPYSYTYEIIREKFNNSFEEKGQGFGFTYNGKLFFLRIDNVFSDKKIVVNSFKVRRDIIYSDHFPLEVTYTF